MTLSPSFVPMHWRLCACPACGGDLYRAGDAWQCLQCSRSASTATIGGPDIPPLKLWPLRIFRLDIGYKTPRVHLARFIGTPPHVELQKACRNAMLLPPELFAIGSDSERVTCTQCRHVIERAEKGLL